MELHESDLAWYKDEGEGYEGSISLEDITTVEIGEYSVEKPQCLLITLVKMSLCY